MVPVALIALQPLTYQGRSIAAGEVFAVTPIEAAALTYQRKARFAPRGTTAIVRTRELVPEPIPEPEPEPPRRRRTYGRRDLTAESE